jgi:DNA-binding NarL/FixJ family response regulator
MQEVVRGMRAVVAGETYLCTVIAREVLEGYRAGLEGRLPRASAALSGRELEVLQLMAEGRCTREIAELLHVSVKTVSSHREHIMVKLGIRSIAGLTKYAIRHGLTTADRSQGE